MKRLLGGLGGSILLAAASALIPSSGHAQSGGTQPGDLPNGGYFASAETCSGWHSQGALSAEDAYLPFTSWAGTMMANAARDPVSFAALTVANQD